MINCMNLNLVHPKQDRSLKSKDLCFGFMSNHVHRYKLIKIFVLNSCLGHVHSFGLRPLKIRKKNPILFKVPLDFES